MKSLEKLRYYSFWGVDFLKGSKVRYHYRDVRFILENDAIIKINFVNEIPQLSSGKRKLTINKFRV